MRNSILSVLVIGATGCAAQGGDPARFSGTFAANDAESMPLPGFSFSPDFRLLQEFDGRRLQIVQTYTGKSGEPISLTWRGVCDGKSSPALGFSPPGSVMRSCLLNEDGTIKLALSDQRNGYAHVETCAMSNDDQQQSCRGTGVFPDGSKHDFKYVYERRPVSR